jgi:hypothetical protein
VTDLNALAELERQRHADAWSAHPSDAVFWDTVDAEYLKLLRRASRWPLLQLDARVIARALKRARSRALRRTRAARGQIGRDLRHELRRKLRRYANLVRAAGSAGHDPGIAADPLLVLAKRCGHEGDLWMVLVATRSAARAQPALRSLAAALETSRRALCVRHDKQLASHLV